MIVSCVSQKNVYATREDALEDRRAIRASRSGGRRLYPYECHLCGQWHLSSHKRQAVLRRMRRWEDR